MQVLFLLLSLLENGLVIFVNGGMAPETTAMTISEVRHVQYEFTG